MRLDAVQRSVVEHGHQLCRRRASVGHRHAEFPRFFRARLQAVAERGPCQPQSAVGLFPHEMWPEHMAFPVLDEIEHGLQAVCVLWQSGISEIENGVGEVIEFLLQYAFLTEQHVVERHAVGRASHLQPSRPARRDGVVHAIKERLHAVGRTAVAHAEQFKRPSEFRRVFFGRGPHHELIVSGRQGRQLRNPHRTVGRQVNARHHFLPGQSFRGMIDVAGHRHGIIPWHTRGSPHHGLDGGQTVFHE